MSEGLEGDNSSQVEREKINQETAEIKWSELQRYFAGGRVVHVGSALDLVDVALYFTQDKAKKIEDLRVHKQLDFVTDQQAKAWFADDILLWAVVVKPWVLVQTNRPSEKSG